MNDKVERIKATYPQGTKIKLICMEGEPQMPAGLVGEVTFVDDMGQLHMKWENGSSLAINYDHDAYETI